jgi:hypothetical protein
VARGRAVAGVRTFKAAVLFDLRDGFCATENGERTARFGHSFGESKKKISRIPIRWIENRTRKRDWYG